MSEVQIIEQSKDRANCRRAIKLDRKRVAAYCRVSTNTEEQKQSYDSQVSHYNQFVNENKDWNLVKIYTDEAISGTQIKNRIGFQDMISDALDGKIDLIITKSISRFARNTLDTLNYVRMLKEKNVAIMFEKENINTLTMNGEMLLVILSSLAQQESESISLNVKMGLKMKMKRGEMVGFNGCLGYDYDSEKKTISINEKEAEIVRYIFDRYISGTGCYTIARELTELKHKTIRGSEKWGESAIRGIIKNEKYKGSLLMGKSFTVDPITHRRLENLGEEDMYYQEKHHDAIIPKEIFEQAQETMKRRGTGKSLINGHKREKYSKKYAFSSMMKCEFCGSTISRRTWTGRGNYKVIVWACVNGTKNGKKNCHNFKSIKEEELESAFVDAFNLISNDNKSTFMGFFKTIEDSIGKNEVVTKVDDVKLTIKKLRNKVSKLVELSIDGIIDKEVYLQQYEELNEQILKNEEKLKGFDLILNDEIDLERKLKKLRNEFSKDKLLVSFDREIFETVIEEVRIGKIDKDGVVNPYSATFVFKNGLKLENDTAIKNPKEKQNTKNNVHPYQTGDTRGVCGTDDKALKSPVYQRFLAKKRAFFDPLKNDENIDDIGFLGNIST